MRFDTDIIMILREKLISQNAIDLGKTLDFNLMVIILVQFSGLPGYKAKCNALFFILEAVTQISTFV